MTWGDAVGWGTACRAPTQIRPYVRLYFGFMPDHMHGVIDDDVGATRRVAPTRRRRAPTQIGPYVRLYFGVMAYHVRGVIDNDVGATRRVAPTRRRRAPTQIGPYVRLSCGVMPHHGRGIIDNDVGRRAASPRHGVAVPRRKSVRMCGCLAGLCPITGVASLIMTWGDAARRPDTAPPCPNTNYAVAR
jgi:hypothetical protein